MMCEMTPHKKDSPVVTNQPRVAENNDGSTIVSSPRAKVATVIGSTMHYAAQHWKVLAFGQFVSILVASSGAAQATLHFNCSLSAPAFSAGLFYSVLSLNLIPLYWKNRKNKTQGGERQYYLLRRIPLHAPVFAYALIAFLDVQGKVMQACFSAFSLSADLKFVPFLSSANFVTVMAFRYTTLTSVSLFDALAIPSAMICSRCVLARRYTWVHIVGVCCCMIGVFSNALADYESNMAASVISDGGDAYPHKMLGDSLAILGGIIFGMNNVLTEMFVRQIGGPTEYLGVMGFFAAIISFSQAALFERGEIQDFFTGVPVPEGSVCAPSDGILLVLSFMTTNSLSYTMISRFLVISEATLLNLSLLTADLWSALFVVVAEHILPSALFWAALIMIITGVFVYEMGPNPILDEGQTPSIENRPNGTVRWQGIPVRDDEGGATSEIEIL
jgi:solute carrier family 35 protein F1/2